MAFYSGHGDESTVYHRTSDNDNDISSMGAEQSFSASDTVTYPTAKEFSNGTIRTHYRAGGDFVYKQSSDAGSTWASEQTLFSSPWQYVKVVQDPTNTDVLHFAVFRHAVLSTDGAADVYYCRYERSSDTYYQADGTVIGTTGDAPFNPSDGDLGTPIYDASESGHNAHGWDMAVDGNGNIGIVYIQFRSPADIRYRSAQWNGSAWEDTELCPAGGRVTQEAQPHYVAGASVKYADPSTLYLARGGDSSIVQKWETDDSGATWSVTDIYDADGLNLRPVSVANPNDDLEVLLASGRYKYIADGGYKTRVFGIDGSAVDHTGQTAGKNLPAQKSQIYLSEDTSVPSGGARVPMDSTLIDNYADVGSSVELGNNGIEAQVREIHEVSGKVSMSFSASGTVSIWVNMVRPSGGSYDYDLVTNRSVSSGDTIEIPFSFKEDLGTAFATYLGVDHNATATALGGRGKTRFSLFAVDE
jgi:hypothetical protein